MPSIGTVGLVTGTVVSGLLFGLTPAATAAPATAEAGGRYIVSFTDAATDEQLVNQAIGEIGR